jgi:hypothetical protein
VDLRAGLATEARGKSFASAGDRTKCWLCINNKKFNYSSSVYWKTVASIAVCIYVEVDRRFGGA